MHKLETHISPWTVTDCPHGFQNPTPRFQALEPIKRPLTASFNANIVNTLKRRIKTQVGRTPTSRSLSKLPKSDTHAKTSPRRAVLLLVPKTADGRIFHDSREKVVLLSLKTKQIGYWFFPPCFSRFLCKTRENFNFLKNGKMVILAKIQKFSRSRMTKRTSPLESSREI